MQQQKNVVRCMLVYYKCI